MGSPFAGRHRPADDELLLDGVFDSPAGWEAERLQALLTDRTPGALTVESVRWCVWQCVWMFRPAAFAYFLPAFMDIALREYDELSDFADELASYLTEPRRADVEELYANAEALSMTAEELRETREVMLKDFDCGGPTATYDARVGQFTPAEADAVLAFLLAIHAAEDYYPDAVAVRAIERHRARFPGAD